MNYTVMAYTRRENRELESAMHLAAVLENGSLQPLQNGTGILFAKAEFNEGPLCGTTKILRKPWVFRLKDGAFGVVCLRRNVGGGLEPGKKLRADIHLAGSSFLPGGGTDPGSAGGYGCCGRPVPMGWEGWALPADLVGWNRILYLVVAGSDFLHRYGKDRFPGAPGLGEAQRWGGWMFDFSYPRGV
mgnify:CR=1 FL=1